MTRKDDLYLYFLSNTAQAKRPGRSYCSSQYPCQWERCGYSQVWMRYFSCRKEVTSGICSTPQPQALVLVWKKSMKKTSIGAVIFCTECRKKINVYLRLNTYSCQKALIAPIKQIKEKWQKESGSSLVEFKIKKAV